MNLTNGSFRKRSRGLGEYKDLPEYDVASGFQLLRPVGDVSHLRLWGHLPLGLAVQLKLGYVPDGKGNLRLDHPYKPWILCLCNGKALVFVSRLGPSLS